MMNNVGAWALECLRNHNQSDKRFQSRLGTALQQMLHSCAVFSLRKHEIVQIVAMVFFRINITKKKKEPTAPIKSWCAAVGVALFFGELQSLFWIGWSGVYTLKQKAIARRCNEHLLSPIETNAILFAHTTDVLVHWKS